MQTYTYEFPRPAVSVDAIVLDVGDLATRVMLIERGGEPFRGHWAFPGGFMDMDETAEQAVVRELREETGITGIKFEQLYTSTAVERDPRGRVVSIIFLGLASEAALKPKAADDAADIRWFPVDDLPPLAFDHAELLERALRHIAKD